MLKKYKVRSGYTSVKPGLDAKLLEQLEPSWKKFRFMLEIHCQLDLQSSTLPSFSAVTQLVHDKVKKYKHA